MRYFIFENQKREDGDVNFIKTEKYTLATALSYYYARKSAYVVDTTYPSVSIMLTDENLDTIEKDDVETQYKAE